MMLRLMTLVVALATVALLVLSVRQQRLATARVISENHNEVDRLRQETRTLMTPISTRTTPEAIRAACRRAGLRLEPVEALGQAPKDDGKPRPETRREGDRR